MVQPRDRRQPGSFTQLDPLEDTESGLPGFDGGGLRGFTQLDPLEDTESTLSVSLVRLSSLVSPNSIRLRILKAKTPNSPCQRGDSFTQLDPLEDTESGEDISANYKLPGFHPTRSA